VIANRDFVVFSDQVENFNVEVGELPIRGADILHGACRALGQAGRNVRAMVDEFRREIQGSDVQILASHKFLKMIVHKLHHFGVGHLCVLVDALLQLVVVIRVVLHVW
jgi:hypothetical protein